MTNKKVLPTYPAEEPIDALFLVASMTPRKVQEYAAILSHIGKSTGKRYVIKALNDYEDYHSPVEDANTLVQNLAKKEAEAMRTVIRLREGGKSHDQFLKRLKETGIVFKGGIETAMARTVVMVDDTTTAIPKDIWEAMLPKLQKLVIADSLKASDCPIKGEDDAYVCVADIGPITSSIGQKEFWCLLAETADKLDKYRGKPIKVYDQVACAFRQVSEPDGAPFEPALSQKPLFVYRAPEGYVPKELVTRSDHFLCPPETPTTPVYENFETYLLEKSMRRDIADDMLSSIVPKLEELPSKIPPNESLALAASETGKKNQKLKAVVFVPNNTKLDPQSYGLEAYDVHPIYLPTKGTHTFEHLNRNQSLTRALSMHFALDNEDTLSFDHADIHVFLPHDASNPVLHWYYNLMIRSAHVAKALDLCQHHVPLLIVNKDGCFDDINASHIAGAEGGFNKEMVLHPVHVGMRTGEQIVSCPNITHTPLFYTDMLDVKDAVFDDAVRDVLSFRLKGYNRISRPPQRPRYFGGNLRPDHIFAATVFASASSDKKIDWDNACAIGRFLAEHRIGLCTGGGDQHLMVASVRGYEKGREKKALNPGDTHLTCVSTHDIVYVETVGGSMPHCDYWELHDTIGPRIETLARSPLLISVGGGDGTEQEVAFAMLKMKYLPRNPLNNAANDKTLLFVGEDPAMLAGIKCILGDEDFAKLQKNRYALADKNIFLARNAKEAETVILMAKTEFDRNNAPALTHNLSASRPACRYHLRRFKDKVAASRLS